MKNYLYSLLESSRLQVRKALIKDQRSFAEQFDAIRQKYESTWSDNISRRSRYTRVEQALDLMDVGYDVLLVEDEDGLIVGAIASTVSDGEVKAIEDKVRFVGSLGSMAPGVGSLLLKEVISQASNERLQVWLEPTMGSRPFYDKLGLSYENGYFHT